MSTRFRVRHIALVLAAGLPLLAPVAARAQAADRPAIAVLPLDNAALTQHAEYASLSTELADQLSAELGRLSGVRVVDRARVQQLLQQQQLGTRTRFDVETAARLGKSLGARWIVVGSYAVDMRGRMRLDARAVNTDTGAADHTVSITEQASDRAKVTAAAARELGAGLKLQ
jgi:TolB-like protein